MDNIYEGGSLLAVWYDNWLVLAGMGIALVLALLVGMRGKWGGVGLFINVIMVLALLAGIPLTMIRIGMDISISNLNAVGYISLFGAVVSVAIGVPYLLWEMTGGSSAELDGEYATDTPAQGMGGVTGGDDFEGQTATLGHLGDQQATIIGAGASTPGQSPTAWLYIKTGPMAGQTIPISPGGVRIGRGSDNDVVLDDPTVSRNHATISYGEGGFVIEDTGSVSGTIVEGAAASKTRLSSGASMRLGDTEVVFMEGEMGGVSAATSGMATDTGARPGSGSGGGASDTRVISSREEVVLAWLAVTDGPDKGKSYQLRVGANTIGRASDNNLSISDTSMSRYHAMIRVQGDEFVLADLGSRGGTRIAGRQLEGKELRTGGIIEVGETRLSLVEVESKGEASPGTMSGETMVGRPGESTGGVLIAQSGPDAGKSFGLVEGDNVIGRDTNGCTVVLRDDTIGRTHALIRKDGERFLVFDLGSRNGTKVDGAVLRGHRLNAGETIAMGRSEVVLMRANS